MKSMSTPSWPWSHTDTRTDAGSKTGRPQGQSCGDTRPGRLGPHSFWFVTVATCLRDSVCSSPFTVSGWIRGGERAEGDTWWWMGSIAGLAGWMSPQAVGGVCFIHRTVSPRSLWRRRQGLPNDLEGPADVSLGQAE